MLALSTAINMPRHVVLLTPEVQSQISIDLNQCPLLYHHIADGNRDRSELSNNPVRGFPSEVLSAGSLVYGGRQRDDNCIWPLAKFVRVRGSTVLRLEHLFSPDTFRESGRLGRRTGRWLLLCCWHILIVHLDVTAICIPCMMPPTGSKTSSDDYLTITENDSSTLIMRNSGYSDGPSDELGVFRSSG